MSTATPQETTPQHDSASDSAQVGAEVEALFAQAAASGPQPRLRGLNGTCQFDLAGAGAWRVTVNDGTVTVAKGASDTAPARCTVACDATDFVRFIRREGNMNLMTAYMQELLTLSGDLPFAFAALGGFILASEGYRPQEEPQEEPQEDHLWTQVESQESQGATP
jgi:hypothetical protein